MYGNPFTVASASCHSSWKKLWLDASHHVRRLLIFDASVIPQIAYIPGFQIAQYYLYLEDTQSLSKVTVFKKLFITFKYIVYWLDNHILYTVFPPVFPVPTCHHSFYSIDCISYAVFYIPMTIL